MKKMMKRSSLYFYFLLVSVLALPLQAQSVNDALKKAKSNVVKSAQAQKRLDSLNLKSDKMYDAFQLENKNLEGSLVWNAQLRKKIKVQEEYIRDITKSIREAATLESKMAPIIEGMIERLEEFVKADMPFHREVRLDQIERLKSNQTDPTISAAERFRQILETYRLETDYSKNIESYRADIVVKGKTLSVNMLRVGRVMLGYQSDDQKYHGVWDKNNKEWVSISAGSYRSAFSELYKITKKQASTNILQLPIHAPEGGK